MGLLSSAFTWWNGATWGTALYTRLKGGTPVPLGYSYNSGANDRFLTVDELRNLIRDHVDRSFSVVEGTS